MGRFGSTTSVRAREMRRVLADWQGSGLTLREFWAAAWNPTEHPKLVAAGLPACRR